MRRAALTFDTVRKIALEFPGVMESTAYGAPALKVRGKLMACIPSHRSAESGSLVVCVDFDDRAELLAEAPSTYYVTEHYVPYRFVLVRFSQVSVDELRDLLGMAYKCVTRKAAGKQSAQRTTRSTGRRR